MSVSYLVNTIMTIVGDFLGYVFNVSHPAIATVCLLPIIAGALGVVSKFAHHKHKN